MQKISIDFTISEMETLAHTACESFVTNQPHRFSLIGDLDAISTMQSIEMNECPGTLFYFGSFLEAKIFQSAYYCFNRVEQAYILVDNQGDESVYCCWTEDDFNSYVFKENEISLSFFKSELEQYEKEIMSKL